MGLHVDGRLDKSHSRGSDPLSLLIMIVASIQHLHRMILAKVQLVSWRALSQHDI